MKVVSYVGGHDVVVYKDAVYDPSIRKYRGGTPVAVIPYGGCMLSATARPAQEEMLLLNGVEVTSPNKIVPIEKRDLNMVCRFHLCTC